MRSEQYDQSGYTFRSNGGSPVERAFTYDALYRLLSATGVTNNEPNSAPWEEFEFDSIDPNATFGYTRFYEYDKLGNIGKVQQTGDLSFTRLFTYLPNTNKIDEVTIGVSTYSLNQYDPNGNLEKQHDNQFYFWGAADQLVKFELTDGTTTVEQRAYYLYDAGGNRVKKVVHNLDASSVLVTTYIDGSFEHEVYTATSEAFERNYIHIADDTRKLATLRIGDQGDDIPAPGWYILDDHLGSSNLRMSLSTGGAIIDREEYYPFGESSFRNFNRKRYRFCGKERDLETGLYYYGARYYLPWVCRFISVDPLAEKYAYYSPYQYAGNKPINKIDIDGLEEKNATESPQTEGEGLGYDYGTAEKPIELAEFEIKSDQVESKSEKKSSFWGWVEKNVVDNIPIVGGLKYAVESAIEGDWKGVLMGLGEATLDAALLVGTGGVGLGLKTAGKVLLKETMQNYIAGEVSDKLSEAGISPTVQIAAGVLFGIRPGKGANPVTNIVWKTVKEPTSLVKTIEKTYGKGAVENYQKLLDQLATGKAGRNIHELGGELKGWSAVDLKGTGKGRGAGRVVFREINGEVEIRGLVRGHDYKNIIE